MLPVSSTSYSSDSSGGQKLYGGNSSSIEGRKMNPHRDRRSHYEGVEVKVYVAGVLIFGGLAQLIQELIQHA